MCRGACALDGERRPRGRTHLFVFNMGSEDVTVIDIHVSDTHGISTICLRIGAVTREDRPTAPRHFSVWCSQRDVAQMVERSIAAPDSVRFEVFYAVSDNKWSYRDLDHARALVGYEPQDRAEDYR